MKLGIGGMMTALIATLPKGVSSGHGGEKMVGNAMGRVHHRNFGAGQVSKHRLAQGQGPLFSYCDGTQTHAISAHKYALGVGARSIVERVILTRTAAGLWAGEAREYRYTGPFPSLGRDRGDRTGKRSRTAELQ